MKTNEKGRSMIEMLGVLAIIGVLSVGGIYGYTVAMRNYRANEIVQTASMLATMAHSADGGEGACVDLEHSGLNDNPGGVAISMQAAAPATVGGVDDIVHVTIGGIADEDLRNKISTIVPAIPSGQNAANSAGARAGYYATVQADAAAACGAGN